MKLKILFLCTALAFVPVIMSAQDSLSNPFAETCLVPIIHTDFRFPPAGGAIIERPSGMYFVRTYLPGCDRALSGSTVIKSVGTDTFPSTQDMFAQSTPAQQPQQFTAPPTGPGKCN